MTWSARGYRVPDAHGVMYQGGDVRIDHICQKCHFHTTQIRVEKGWRCKECRTIQKEES